jgi:DNA-binding MarR family transcriptional regulator
MPKIPNDDAIQTWRLFLKAHSTLVETLDQELQATKGLPLTWFDVMVRLVTEDEGRLPMNELADRVLLSKSGVTRLVDRMARAGLIERMACPTDRRVIWATLTDKGRKAFEEAAPIAYRGVQEHFTAFLTKTEMQAMRSGLGKITEAHSTQPAERAAG